MEANASNVAAQWIRLTMDWEVLSVQRISRCPSELMVKLVLADQDELHTLIAS